MLLSQITQTWWVDGHVLNLSLNPSPPYFVICIFSRPLIKWTLQDDFKILDSFVKSPVPVLYRTGTIPGTSTRTGPQNEVPVSTKYRNQFYKRTGSYRSMCNPSSVRIMEDWKLKVNHASFKTRSSRRKIARESKQLNTSIKNYQSMHETC